jgi:hypothetical protein
MSMDKPSKTAASFIKALESYEDDESNFRLRGWELSHWLSPRQRRRFVLVYKGYQEGRELYD